MSGELSKIVPELALAGTGLLFLVLPRLKSARMLGLLSLAALAAAFNGKLLEILAPPSFLSRCLFHGMLVQDRFGRFLELAILAAAGLTALAGMGYRRQELGGRREFWALLLLCTVGALLVAGARNLALIYLGLEVISLFPYLMTGFLKKEPASAEGALKYFLFGALSTGAFLYGVSLLYGLTGTLDLAGIGANLPAALERAPMLAAAAGMLMVVGAGFKLALVPFHLWAPDAYEGAPTPVAAYVSLAPKLAAFAVLVRILLTGFGAAEGWWSGLLAAAAVLTMTVGNLAALFQTNVKRLLAYSSVAHAGTMVIGVAVATPLGLTALLYYLVAYLFMNAGAFLGVIAVGNAEGREDLEAFRGLSRRAPALAFGMAVFLLSLGGVPPLAGFFGKLWIFAAALEGGMAWLAVAAAVNSVIAFFYYMRVVKAMYLDPAPAGAPAVLKPASLRVGLAACAAGLLAMGLCQGPWLAAAADALPLPFSAEQAPLLPLRTG